MWIPATVLIITILIVWYFFEKSKDETNEAKTENDNLKSRLRENTGCSAGKIDASGIAKSKEVHHKEEVDRVEIINGWQITTMKNGDVYQGLVPEQQALYDTIEPHWIAARRFLDYFLEEKDWIAREIADEYYDILQYFYTANKKAFRQKASTEFIAVDLPQAIIVAIAKRKIPAQTPEVRDIYKRCIEMQIDLGISEKSEYDSKIALFDTLVNKQHGYER